MHDSPPPDNVDDLKIYWDSTKQRLQRACPQHPLAVRMHRTFSWLAAAECEDPDDQLDEKLIFRWIGLNSLFGRWNSCDHEPERDGRALTGFLTVMEECDKDALIKAYLIEQQTLISQICSDPFVRISRFARLARLFRRQQGRPPGARGERRRYHFRGARQPHGPRPSPFLARASSCSSSYCACPRAAL